MAPLRSVFGTLQARSGEAPLTGVEFTATWLIVAYIVPLIWAGRLIERRHRPNATAGWPSP
jgi:hypothetical protein